MNNLVNFGKTMTLFSEKVLISNKCISGLMSNLIKKSWTDSSPTATVSHFDKDILNILKQ